MVWGHIYILVWAPCRTMSERAAMSENGWQGTGTPQTCLLSPYCWASPCRFGTPLGVNSEWNIWRSLICFSCRLRWPTLRKDSILVFVWMVHYHQVNDSKFCPSFYSRDLLSFDSLSRDWILKLDPNDNFRKDWDIHNSSIDPSYPWVMTPLSNTRLILVCMSSL